MYKNPKRRTFFFFTPTTVAANFCLSSPAVVSPLFLTGPDTLYIIQYYMLYYISIATAFFLFLFTHTDIVVRYLSCSVPLLASLPPSRMCSRILMVSRDGRDTSSANTYYNTIYYRTKYARAP